MDQKMKVNLDQQEEEESDDSETHSLEQILPEKIIPIDRPKGKQAIHLSSAILTKQSNQPNQNQYTYLDNSPILTSKQKDKQLIIIQPNFTLIDQNQKEHPNIHQNQPQSLKNNTKNANSIEFKHCINQRKNKPPKSRLKRFNLQVQQLKQKHNNQSKQSNYEEPQNPQLQLPILLKPSATKIKPKLGTGQFPPQSILSLTTWNVNGIRFSIYKNHLSYYINQTKPDILCLTETKMDEFSFNKQPIHVFGFNGYWNFCKCSLGYSGVVVFSKFEPIRVIEGIRSNLSMTKIQQIKTQNLNTLTNETQNKNPSQNNQNLKKSCFYEFPQQQNYGDDFDKQGRVLTLQFKEFFLVTVYTPAAGKQLQRLHYKCKEFEPRFFAFCQFLMTKKQVIIAGDLNTALTQNDTHMTKNTKKGPAFTVMERQSLLSFINRNNLVDTYRFKNPTKKQFTWWHIKYFGRQYAIGKRIDYFLTTEGLKQAIVSSEIKQKFKGSDHSPLQLKLDLRRLSIKRK